MIIDFDWFSRPEVQNVINMVYKVLELVRIAVPVGLIVMTSLDIAKKVINPEEKEGQKKIMIRFLAAVLVFLTPTIINIVLNIANIEVPVIETKPVTTSKPTNTPKNNPRATVKPIVTPSSTIKPTATPSPTPTPTATPTPKPTTTPTPTPSPTLVPQVTFISIVNCPSKKTFKNGDTIQLKTNIPSYYSGEIMWGCNSDVVGNIDVIVESNYEYTLYVSNVTRGGSITVIANLDSTSETDICKFYIEP